MRRAVRLVAAAAALATALLAIVVQPAAARERTYYVAADDVVWNPIPSGRNLEGSRPIGPIPPSTLGWKFHLLVYRQYTDDTFKVLAKRPDDQLYLGITGPLMRAEVGDTIVVVFKNDTRFPVNMRPNGLKSTGGLALVAPGSRKTYRWSVPASSGPGPSDGSSILWTYQADGKDLADSGLYGPIIVTRHGMARPDGSPNDVDREFVVWFHEIEDTVSPTWTESLADPATNPHHLKATSFPPPVLFNNNIFVNLNGFAYGNMPMLFMHRGERVRWYVFTSSSSFDFHAPSWEGQTVLYRGTRLDVIPLNLNQPAAVDMIPDNPGVWQIYCSVNIHLDGGMEARFTVLP
ncbi:MAG TPA: multicopper oxidase domain-containing protein [Candidatus Eremiobacteraceae bacterium]|nr:multicopper oxidase domain-containing protein [Candidatus Eremiobacteraceae bacterium]